MDTFENTDILCIDPDAKLRVSLTKIKKVEPFYIGKLQFPSPLDFEDGISFMAFLAEDECEELQIAPLDPSRRVRRDGFGMCTVRDFGLGDRSRKSSHIRPFTNPSICMSPA